MAVAVLSDMSSTCNKGVPLIASLSMAALTGRKIPMWQAAALGTTIRKTPVMQKQNCQFAEVVITELRTSDSVHTTY